MRPKDPILLLSFLVLSSSCISVKATEEESKIFNYLNQIEYPFTEFKNENRNSSISDFLKEDEILILKNWNNSLGAPERLLQSECIGCPDHSSDLRPVYKVHNGKFIHFGLGSSQGIQNLIFRKNGAFTDQFYLYEGASQQELQQEAEKKNRTEFEVIAGVYPIEIGRKKLYQELYEDNPLEAGENWYATPYPTQILFERSFLEKREDLGFRFQGGLYSIQGQSDSGEFRIYNFVEPIYYANAMDTDAVSHSSITDAFYANATFFLLDLESDMNVSIQIKSHTPGKDYRFSVLKNQEFLTINEYLKNNAGFYDQYRNKLKKGSYLIRILHEDSDYAEKRLYTVYIDKTTVDQ
ncbi:hypothetical protein PBT90_05840 [Algoriphagus halophytocola]|uniref:Uncharacterized protein n=1 Tax=Algoriphagus halophytocola TaxID=2991499 RepID=A0ABY6MH11_9BACT|nr:MULTISPECIES: hypothetical protein [unclassified Algoriphagus]UZD22938.1 hypothetical protein OM944_00285 [Algoriphagus sp. TR-M5]WBL44207.1 hypothetical protein PBT90_05840 [Algoriphagus sp. TR-M9]